MNETTQLCLGCYRTAEEITRWWEMEVEEQRALLPVLEQRQLEHLTF